MPTNVGFFTAIKYKQETKSCIQSALEIVDNYFYLGGKKAYVIQERTKKAVLCESKVSFLANFGKILSYFTIILPLAMLTTKTILRSTHTFRLIDPKKKLEKGININEDTIAKLQGLMSEIQLRKDHDEITWLARGNNLVFKLVDSPNLVFKMAPAYLSVARAGKLLDSKARSDERFSNMIKAKTVCLAHQLGQLVIPHSKIIEIDRYTLIAEEALDLTAEESTQEMLYHEYSADLNEAVRQLAIFVAKTGFNDVSWRNIPVLNEAREFQGPRKVALIDIENMGSIITGFTGDDSNGSRGLIRCVSKAQIDMVIAEAKRQGVSAKNFRNAKESRLQELELNKELRQFYENNGIVTGEESIEVDLESLDIDLTEEGKIRVLADFDVLTRSGLQWEDQTVTVRQVTKDVIAEINRLIQESPKNASVKGKRYIVLQTHQEPFRQYSRLGLPPGKNFINEEEEKHLWLNRIIQALIDKGYLFKLDKVNGHGYFIQA